ncbi:MAG TPA: MraY family glycosyltransferase [Chitinophagaceae bacterium]|jgi:UDP-GlcNAc:undecaprenyl-phosphate GlcNAc-1-phosphate transferase|nr:undecaprenyl/decaprenyl-phosphate alpha-N-acetylglucosaminyl 1-phosphate transferase [Chitinophagaceae bacterium]OPZ17043.1 MAG: Undecaprenyl-phosphate alpha-N-acetylglucosaminyl 1-phosphate transferase [Bacteroidetes bacterium ADurb.BinA245]HMW65825.1 MraY family glycosyltransferase [Chitinophagaceae bacterium]HNA19311.1 MraY family glycosyltransferase [Chitinophagaceae bacterium]HNA90810.1 MraY family glycosyltransferase [Chitinophagaceae bacterium]
MFGLDILLTASVAFIITFLSIPVVMQVAEKKKLYDIPDERKLHTRLIASLGGVGIFAGFILASLLSIQGSINPEFQAYFAAAIVIFFLGLKDDIMILSASKKFVGQLLAASIIIHLGDLRLDSLHGLFGVEKVSEGFGLAITYLTIIVVMNSFNLIDGVDGLAASLGILSMIVFGIYFFFADMQAYALLSFAMAGSLTAFIIFNHHPAKIFMGDSGSLMVGMINSILVIKFILVADKPLATVPMNAVVAIGFAILIVPLLDTLRVFSVRIINGRSPFSPDRNHIHHLLLDRGLNHAAVTFTCVAINVLFILLAYFGQPLGPNYLLFIMLSIAFSGLGVLYYQKARKRLVVSKDINGKVEIKRTSKIFDLTKKQKAKAASDN